MLDACGDSVLQVPSCSRDAELWGIVTENGLCIIYIYFINHYLSASLLQPSGVKHDMCDRLSHVNE
jgi:hypothetical protein